MSTARSVMRGLVAENLGTGQYLGLSTTSQGGASGINAICSTLIGKGTDAFANWWASLLTGPTDANGTYEDREVSGSTSATGTLTVSGIRNFSAQVASGLSLELHRYPPDSMHRAINRSIRSLFPDAELPVRDESLVVNNRLQNWDFETGSFTNWTNFGSPTVTAQTAAPYVWHGSQSAKVVSGAGAAGGFYQDIVGWPVPIDKVTDKSVTFKCRVWCDTASASRLRLSFDGGSTFTNGDYHTGTDQWELLEVTADVPTAATGIRCYCEVAAGTLTAYFDASWAKAGEDIYRYTISTSFVVGPSEVSYQLWDDHAQGPFVPRDDWHIEEDGATRYLILDNIWTEGCILRLQGLGLYTTYSLTSDTGTSEFDHPRTELVAAKATAFLYEQLAADDMDGADFFRKQAAQWHTLAQDMSQRAGLGRVFYSVPRGANWFRR